MKNIEKLSQCVKHDRACFRARCFVKNLDNQTFCL